MMRFLSPVRSWLVAVGATLAALLAAYVRGRRDQRRDAEARGLRDALRRREVRDEVERDLARRGDAAERLRERWSRD